MTCETLPVVPKALFDESLSSWVERITLFYGGDFEVGLGAVYARAGRLPWRREHDIDIDAQMREGVCAWTGTNDNDVPAILDSASLDTLPRQARLTYCPACWDADVAASQAPYVRRRWLRWSVVHCERHRCWLTSKRPAIAGESQHLGWSPLWKSRHEWARCFELSVQQSFAQILAGFEPASIELPDLDWNSLNADLLQFALATDPGSTKRRHLRVHKAILDAVRFGPLDSLRYKIAERIAPENRCNDIFDRVRSRVPLWQAARVLSLLIAVEYLRVTKNQAPVNADVSMMVQACSDLSDAVRSGVWDMPDSERNELTNGETFPQRLTNRESFPQFRRGNVGNDSSISQMPRLEGCQNARDAGIYGRFAPRSARSQSHDL